MRKESRGDKVWLVDFENPENNEFLACNQFTVVENNTNKRPDVVLFVNGLPLVVLELKNPTDENATVQKAFTQLQNYKNAIPSLFTITPRWLRPMVWTRKLVLFHRIFLASWRGNQETDSKKIKRPLRRLKL